MPRGAVWNTVKKWIRFCKSSRNPTGAIQELNGSIVAAADERKTATADVLRGIQSIRDAASLTIGEMEKTALAAREMQNLSEELGSSVGHFRCDEAVEPSGRPGDLQFDRTHWRSQLGGASASFSEPLRLS